MYKVKFLLKNIKKCGRCRCWRQMCNICTCKNGAHLVGCCAHVTIIWYLGYAKNLEGGIYALSEHLDSLFVSLDSSNEDE